MIGLVQDMAPVVKTLPEAHEASLLYHDNGDVLADDASDRSKHEVDEPLRKRFKSDFGTHHSLTLSCPRGSPLTSKIVWC